MDYSVSSLKSYFYAAFSKGGIRKSMLRELSECPDTDFDGTLTRYIERQRERLLRKAEETECRMSPFSEMTQTVGKGKPVYCLAGGLFSYLYMGVLCQELEVCYPISRNTKQDVAKMLKEELDNGEDHIILRYDVAQCIESLPSGRILQLLREDGKICRQSFDLLESVVDAYAKLSGSSLGLPRGIKSSTVLLEIYFALIDHRINNLPGVCRYMRMVDDSFVVADKVKNQKNAHQLFGQIQSIYNEYGLTLHNPDEWPYKGDLVDDKSHFRIAVFGYDVIKEEGKPVRWELSENESIGVMFSIKEIFDRFVSRLPDWREKAGEAPFPQLLRGLRNITSHFRYHPERKRKICVGFSFDYPLLTTTKQLAWIDTYLEQQIQRIRAELIPDGFMGAGTHFSKEETAAYIRKRCLKFSLEEGYTEHKFTNLFTKKNVV